MSKLFYDDEFDSLALTISNSDKTFKQCAAFLFPSLKPESQYATLKNCLNAQHDAKLSFGQIIALCAFCECYDALYFMADELNHDRPAVKKPGDEMAELQREFISSVHQQKKIADRIERLTESKLKAVAS